MGARNNWRTFPKRIKNNEIKNELDEIKEWEEKSKWKDLIYKTNKFEYDIQQYETIRSFVESIYAGKITTDESEEDQSNLLKNIVEFNKKSRPRTKEGKDIKRDTYENVYALYEGRELTLNAFRGGIFPTVVRSAVFMGYLVYACVIVALISRRDNSLIMRQDLTSFH